MKSKIPPLQTGKSVWYGPAMNQRKEEWILHLSPSEIKELESAAEHFQQSGNSIGEMNKKQFELPTFSKKLAILKTQLIQGIGFGLLKGCLLYTSPSPRDATLSRMPSSA